MHEREREIIRRIVDNICPQCWWFLGSLRLTAADSVCVCVFVTSNLCFSTLGSSTSSFVPVCPVLLVSGWCCSRLSSRLRRRKAGTNGRSRSPTRILSACLRSKLPTIGEGPGLLCSRSIFLSLLEKQTPTVKGWDGYALSLSPSLPPSIPPSLSPSLSFSLFLSLCLSVGLSPNGQRQWSLRNTRSANMAALDNGGAGVVCASAGFDYVVRSHNRQMK